MFRCFKYLCSAISSWRGWEYLLKKKKKEWRSISSCRKRLNAGLQSEWILRIPIQFSANILFMIFKMQCDWLPIQKKYRGRPQKNPQGETCSQKIYTCLSSASLHSTVFASETPFMLFPLPKKNTNEIQLQLQTQNMPYSRIYDIHIDYQTVLFIIYTISFQKTKKSLFSKGYCWILRGNNSWIFVCWDFIS